jgi:hypothetical protein
MVNHLTFLLEQVVYIFFLCIESNTGVPVKWLPRYSTWYFEVFHIYLYIRVLL